MRMPVAPWMVAALAAASFQARADKPGDPPHQRFEEGDLPLEGGGVIKDFSLSYVTQGKLNAQKSNAILMMASLGGNHHRIDFMIGPGKALDTNKYFVIATDAIANGRTTSPSNSKTQHGTAFPHFVIRDDITAYRKLLDHLGIRHLVAVTGASMGGMQALQYAVSFPGEVDAVIAMTPLARTPAWTVAVTETTRKAILADPAYQNGNYTRQPEGGWRAEIDVLFALATRAPDGMKAKFPHALDVIPWMKGIEDAQLKAGFDANDWMYQTWAYDRFDVSTTPGKPFNGDLAAALKSIRARTIILHDRLDLLNPVEDAKEAAELIPGARFYLLPFDPPAGHFTASAMSPLGVEFINKTVAAFLAENHLCRRRLLSSEANGPGMAPVAARTLFNLELSRHRQSWFNRLNCPVTEADLNPEGHAGCSDPRLRGIASPHLTFAPPICIDAAMAPRLANHALAAAASCRCSCACESPWRDGEPLDSA